jgi:signal transduction histidine kinase
MKKREFKITPFLLAAVFVVIAAASESVYYGNFEYKFRTQRFNRILHEKEKTMEVCLEGMKPVLARGEKHHGSVRENDLFALAEKNSITLLEYMGGRLIYWSDTDFDVPRVLADSLYMRPFIFIQNGWFLTKSIEAGNERLIALMRIRSDYGFENDIIRNGFVRDFRIPAGTGFSRDKNTSVFHVFSSDGTFLLALDFPEIKANSPLIYIPLFLWAISFLLIIYSSVTLVKLLSEKGHKTAGMIMNVIIFLGVYLFVLLLRKPSILFSTGLFSPYKYSMNEFIPSLGHLLLLSTLISVLSVTIYNHVEVNFKRTISFKPGYIIITLLLIPSALLAVIFDSMFGHLVFNSNINFETYKVLDLDMFSLAGYISMLLLVTLPYLYTLKLFRAAWNSDAKVIIPAILTTSLVCVPFHFYDLPALIVLMVFYISGAMSVWILNKRSANIFNRLVALSLILGLYTLYIVTSQSERKSEENVKIQLVTYSTENDPTAEHLLLDMWPKISADSVLRDLMDVPVFESDDATLITDYLHTKYFNGYWGNFNLNIYLCGRNDPIRTGDRTRVQENCFRFFENKIIASGHQLTGTGFYFIDSKQGRSSYMGRLFFDYGNSMVNGLFLDLYSDIKVFQPGYSELLLDRKYHSYARLRDYSFAKYINGELVLTTGEYPYSKSDAEYVGKTTDYRFFNADQYKHALYRNGNVTVLISRPRQSVQDMIISVAYFFAFIFIFYNLLIFLIRRPVIKKPSALNFRQKMQLSFIGILLFSFTLVGIVVASLAIDQYQTRHYENIREKLNSVYLELENAFGSERTISPDRRNNDNVSLDELLVNLSNVFNTDINLFDRAGYLISTSRPEIYYRNLTGRRLNNLASINLVNLKKSEYFQNEKIGNLEYVSVYVPFYNSDKEFLAFLNLPYFRMQSVLAKDISNMIVAVINFTLLLIVVATSLAVFISSRLTSPLAVLSNRLASVELGKKSEHLTYRGNDEVGELVKQYNRMVDELEESARKLARSEREYAWREMAKQIAHEIKNPLTPMKLNVQQLFKSWTDGIPGFEKKLEKFTKNQIEYIDNLSSIASAFSSFAKIPEANPVKVDLLGQIKTTFELFRNTENITFRITCPYTEKIFIYADKEHVNSIFSNLIKNAIQSIEPGREGIVRVNIVRGNEKILVSVSDNGSGIPESFRDKMFTPNFTTKSSGTGLGLSIVKRYVENAGGRIWFESEDDVGSTFHIEFPVADQDVSKGNASQSGIK